MRILTMRRLSKAVVAVLAALLLPIALTIPAPASTAGQVLNCTLPVAGTVTAIDAKSGTFTMTVTSNGVGSVTVWVQKATVIVVREVEPQTQVVVMERPARFADLRVGDRVLVQAMCLDDGRLLAISGAIIHLASSGLSAPSTAIPPTGSGGGGGGGGGNPPSPGGPSNPPSNPPTGGPSPAPAPLVVVTGTVLGKTTVSLTVGGPSLATVTVRIAPATQVGGQRNSFATIMLNDIVRIEALRGSGGVLQAKTISVLAVQVKTITGTITAISTANGNTLITIDGTIAVRINSDTVVLVNGVARTGTQAVAELTVGARVTVTAAVETAKDTATSATATVKATVQAVAVKILK